MRALPVVLLCIATALLAGCGSSTTAASTGSSTPTTTATTTTTTTTAATSARRGPIPKRIGDLAGAGKACTTIDTCDLKLTITKITDCTGGYAGDPPPSGTTRKLIWLDITTGPTYNATDLPSYPVTDFSSISTDGISSNSIGVSTSWECVTRADRLGFGDATWMPNKKYRGAVEVYLPNNAAKVVNGDGLWEWSLT
jgi:uncharacterized protein YceK